MINKRPLLILCSLIVALAASTSLDARNIDLSTVPNRDTVQLTIYNSEDLTLVRETRKVSFKPGVNALQFSWANTLIDPSSVELRFLSKRDKLDVLDTTFPHDKPQMLYWNVQSEIDGEAVIEITYFTSGISWSADYECIADAQEKNLHLDGFVRVSNNSGKNMRTPRCDWWWARSISSRRSLNSPAFPCRMWINWKGANATSTVRWRQKKS